MIVIRPTLMRMIPMKHITKLLSVGKNCNEIFHNYEALNKPASPACAVVAKYSTITV